MPKQVIVEGGWRNKLSLPVIARLGIPVIHTWNLSVPMWEYHHGFQVASLLLLARQTRVPCSQRAAEHITIFRCSAHAPGDDDAASSQP